VTTAAARQSAIRNPKSAIARRPSGWIDARHAADLLGKTVRTVQAMCAAGRLGAVRVEADGTETWAIDPSSHPTLRMALGTVGGAGDEATALADLTAAKRETVLLRLAAVRECRAAEAVRPASMSADTFARRWAEAWNLGGGRPHLSARTLQRWARAYGEGGVLALADRRRASRGEKAISPDAWVFIQGLYLNEERPTARACYERALAVAGRRGWHVPSERTVRKYCADLDAKVRAAGRDPRRFRDRCLPHVVRDWEQVAAMEVWVGDHRQFDLLWPRAVWDSKKGLVWNSYRPWHTVYLDARSWMPATWYAAFDSPNSDRVIGAFVRGVREHGAPAWVYLDNGKDFRAGRFAGGRAKREKAVARDHVEPLLEALGVRAVWALPYNARAKVVEPWFRLEAERFDKAFETYCGRDLDHRPERLKGFRDRRALALRLLGPERVAEAERIAGSDPVSQARRDEVCLAPFRAAFETWITEDYARRESPAAAAKPLSPARAFVEMRSPDFVCARPPDRDLAMLLLPSRAVGVSANGIYVPAFGAYYWDQGLEGCRADPRKKVCYRYDPADPGAVYVFSAAGGEYLATATPYVGQGLHPLAETGSAEAARLAETIALARSTSKSYRSEVAGHRTFARDLLAAARDGAEAAGLLDPADPAPAPTAVIKPLSTAIARAAADREAGSGRRAARASAAGPDPLAELARKAAAASARRRQTPPAAGDALERLVIEKESAHVESKAG